MCYHTQKFQLIHPKCKCANAKHWKYQPTNEVNTISNYRACFEYVLDNSNTLWPKFYTLFCWIWHLSRAFDDHFTHWKTGIKSLPCSRNIPFTRALPKWKLEKCLHWKPLIVRTARKHSLKFNFAKMAYNIDTKEWKCRKNKVNFPLFENCHWLMFSDYKKMPAVLLLKHNTNVHKFYKWQSPKMFKLCLSCVIWHGQNFLPNVKTPFNGTHAMHIT